MFNEMIGDFRPSYFRRVGSAAMLLAMRRASSIVRILGKNAATVLASWQGT